VPPYLRGFEKCSGPQPLPDALPRAREQDLLRGSGFVFGLLTERRSICYGTVVSIGGIQVKGIPCVSRETIRERTRRCDPFPKKKGKPVERFLSHWSAWGGMGRLLKGGKSENLPGCASRKVFEDKTVKGACG
jgi:hypothetical protein